jgi:chemotaxis protein CheX
MATATNTHNAITQKIDWPAVMEKATREVFDLMVGSALERCGRDGQPPLAEFTVTIGLSGELRGLVAFHCSADSACMLASKMLQAETHEFNEQALDAIGEICNMVAGNLKAKLPGIGDRCSISTPTIISGTSYKVHAVPESDHYAICMEFEGAPIWVTLDLRK